MRIALFGAVFAVLILAGILLQFNGRQIPALKQKNQELEKQLARERANYQTLYYEWQRERDANRARAPEPSARRSQTQITIEQQKLESLKSQLAAAKKELTEPDAHSEAAAHIHESEATVAQLQARLDRLRSDDRGIHENSEAYRQNQVQAERQALTNLTAKRANVQTALSNLKANLELAKQLPKGPDRALRVRDFKSQIEPLNTQLRQLNQQIRAAQIQDKKSAASVHQEVKSEEAEVHAERTDLERQLSQAKADLDHWNKISKGTKARAISTDKINLIQEQIDTQEHLIKQLQEQPAGPGTQ